MGAWREREEPPTEDCAARRLRNLLRSFRAGEYYHRPPRQWIAATAVRNQCSEFFPVHSDARRIASGAASDRATQFQLARALHHAIVGDAGTSTPLEHHPGGNLHQLPRSASTANERH